MTQSAREREVKLDVPIDFDVPVVSDVLPGSTVARSTIRLRSTYFDTVDLTLLGHTVTLRRRDGDDTGWHLKVPAGRARDEIRMPLDDRSVPPDELTGLLGGIVRPGTLVAVATLDTERRLTRVHRDGQLVVEIADDRVVASTHERQTDDWREVEIELGPAGDEDLLAAFTRALTTAGARPAGHASKLGRALGRATLPSAGRCGAQRHLAGYLHEQFRWLVAGDIALRRGRTDAVRRTRVSVRRLRGVLRVFGDSAGHAAAIDPTAARALAAELSWYQGLLGEVRDRQVQRERLAVAVAALPAELVIGPVAERIDQALSEDEHAAVRALIAALTTNRYRRLLATVAAVADGAHLDPDVRTKDLRRLADRASSTANERLARAVPDGDAVALHRARTAVARARYAAELVGNTKAVLRTYAHVQDVLGDHQDAVVAAGILRRLCTSAEPGAGFTYGVLHQRELELARGRRAAAASLGLPS